MGYSWIAIRERTLTGLVLAPCIILATYGDTFSGAGSPRLELGVIVLTNQLKFLCLGKCQKDPDW